MTAAEVSGAAGDRPILSLDGLSRRFGETHAVRDVSLDIPEGEFLTIVGPSGSGKSTLVRLLAGLDVPSAGTLRLRGKDITTLPANRRPTALVFQSLALFDHQTVGQNVEFAMKMKGTPADERKRKALELLELVRLPADYHGRSVRQCSGGERQRIALARAFASEPEILFFDEPLSAIDYRLRKTLEVELKDLHARTGRTFVYITHSLEEAMVMSDRIAIMKDGGIIQLGAPAEIYRRPASRFVASFMGEVNIFEVQDGRLAGLEQPVDSPGGSYAVIRPEDVRPGNGDFAMSLRVDQRIMLGSRTQLRLHSAHGASVISEIAGPAEEFEVGTEHLFAFAQDDIAWVDE